MGRKKLNTVTVGGKVPQECREYWVALLKSLGYEGQGGKPLWGKFFVAVWKGDIVLHKKSWTTLLTPITVDGYSLIIESKGSFR